MQENNQWIVYLFSVCGFIKLECFFLRECI